MSEPRSSPVSQSLADELAAYCETLRDEDRAVRANSGGQRAEFEQLAATVRRLERHWSRHDDQHVVTDSTLRGISRSSAKTVGRFLIRHEIGRGGFGVVFKAHDPRLDRPVALKLPRGDVWADDDAVARFQREAKIVAALEHPAIVPIYEAGFIGPACYIASMYCDGPDLARWLRDNPQRLTPRETAEIVAQLAAAIHYAHQRGVIHRDIKPSNVLLAPLDVAEAVGLQANGTSLAFRPRLTDFGLARMETDEWSTTRTSLIVGTPLYMAPECFMRASTQWTPASDIYSLGAVMYEMLTGNPPIVGETIGEIIQRIQHDEPQPPHAVVEDVPIDLSTICSKCLAKEPADRYATAEELGQDLERFLRGEAIHARRTTWRDRFARWRRQPARLVFAGRYSVWFNVIVIAWLFVTATFLKGVVPHRQWWESIVDIVLVSIIFHLPKIWFAYRVVQGARWAYWPATISSLFLNGILLLAATGIVLFFDQNYPTVHSRVSTYSIIITASLLETINFLLALPARDQRKQTASPGPQAT